jgi:hypothetical protein
MFCRFGASYRGIKIRWNPRNGAPHPDPSSYAKKFLGNIGIKLSRAASGTIYLRKLRRPLLKLSYFDVFWVSAAVAVVLVFLVLLMRRSVAAKGTHVGAE